MMAAFPAQRSEIMKQVTTTTLTFDGDDLVAMIELSKPAATETSRFTPDGFEVVSVYAPADLLGLVQANYEVPEEVESRIDTDGFHVTYTVEAE